MPGNPVVTALKDGDPNSPNAKDWKRTSFRLKRGVSAKELVPTPNTEVTLTGTILQLSTVTKAFASHYVDTALIQLDFCSVNGARNTRNRKASVIRRKVSQDKNDDLVAQIAALDARKRTARSRWKLGMKQVVINQRKRSTYLEEMAKTTTGGKTGASAGAAPTIEEGDEEEEEDPETPKSSQRKPIVESLPVRSQSVDVTVAPADTPGDGNVISAPVPNASASTSARAEATDDKPVVVKATNSKKKGCVVS
jgi:hypothetical protein